MVLLQQHPYAVVITLVHFSPLLIPILRIQRSQGYGTYHHYQGLPQLASGPWGAYHGRGTRLMPLLCL